MTARRSTNSPTPPADPGALPAAVRSAAGNQPLLNALGELYRQVDLRTASLTCRGCGQCCDFPNAGHRLYASTAELALLIQCPAPRPLAVLDGLCPYQVNGRCGARDWRCLGCRVFYCDAYGNTLQSEYVEHLHFQVRVLHQTFCTPYLYADIISSMRQLLADEEVR